MARLNTRRSQTTDSLYRGRTASETLRGNSPNVASDKENQNPQAQGKQSMNQPSRPPLSTSNMLTQGNKRRRLDSPQVRLEEILSQHPRQDEDEDKKYFDPEQDEDLRRDIRLAIRDNHRSIHDDRDDFMKDTDKLIKTIKYQDGLMGQVRQTSDAVLDSRFLLDTTELSSKKIANEAFGSGSLGVDVDLFVSRCITFMKLGGNIGSDNSPSTSNQTRRNETRSITVVDDEDDDPEEDDPLAWDVLGSRAAFLCNRRPAAPSFLLGPLAVEKRVRNTQRAARSQRRDPVVAVSRPEELQAEDLEANQSSNVTKICNGIKSRLQLVLEEGEKGIEMDADEDMTEAEAREVFRKHNLSMNFEVPLFEFAFNPHSFAQTVENLFYVSFLVRDGYVRLTEDDQGLPTLRIDQPREVAAQHERGVSRHQAIFSLDYGTWHKIIAARKIKESLIPHRLDDNPTQVGGRGWYG